MFNRICKIILIRHGLTTYNEEERLFNGEDYPPLNESGKEEIEVITEWLKRRNPKIDGLYTSSALRAIQSARIIAKAYKTEFEIIDNLYERKAGIWGGLTFEQIEKKYPKEFEQYKSHPFDFWPEGGETTKEMNQRVEKIFADIVNNNKYKTIVIVTHIGVIQSAVASALGIPAENQAKVLVHTGSATQLNYYNYGASLAYSSYTPQT